MRTGRSDGQLEHWLKAPPEHVAQSGWQVRQLPEALKVLEGQLATHVPEDASWLPAQVRQNFADPEQDEQEESHCLQVLSVESRNVPEGQDSMHLPPLRTKPGRHPVHCSWLTVEPMLNPGIPHPVHFEGQPKIKGNTFSVFHKRGRKGGGVLSHSCLLLSAIRLEFGQTPFPSALTQLPLNLYVPVAQIMQSFDVGPEHVAHDGEQGLQLVPSLTVPTGHAFPVDVVVCGAIHFVLSLAS